MRGMSVFTGHSAHCLLRYDAMKEQGSEQVDKVQTVTIPVVPLGKPRMTRRDKWAKRPCVMRYREYADALRAAFKTESKMSDAPLRLDWQAYFPMPESWSKSKKEQMRGAPHRQKPDRDNTDKGILDSLFAEDSTIAHGTLEKYWDDGLGPRLILTLYW